MEIIAELVLGFILESLIPAIIEISFDFLWRCLGQTFISRESRNGFMAGVGYFLFGLILGGLSLLVFPQSFVRSERFHGINLLITPVVSGLLMAAIGRWRARHGDPLLRIDSFVYGFVFAFAMALVRFVYTT
ncbi:MAG TPA: hypothetical protein VFT08_05260 [Pyrinomonadaceae bacterium]|nr:hypothetical protein [Pyrinomonadaceae bacterium]